MATKTAERPKPRLNNLDELFKLNSTDTQQPPVIPSPEPSTEKQNTVFKILPFTVMDDFAQHPFRLYEGERKADMVDSIRDKGILQPLILRAKENDRYEILSGHNRKYCGMEAGLDAAPVVIKYNLSDEEAWIYVIETNLLQRSFSDMLPSEKAAVLSLEHSKLFSQGKRNDILEELQKLENPQDNTEKSTSSQFATKLRTDQKIGETYGLAKDTVARYVRIHTHLNLALKNRMDNGSIGFIPAVTLSFLKDKEQDFLDKCIELNGFKVDIRKADILRGYSEKGKLNDDNIYLILNGELGQPPKKKRTPTFKIKQKVYSRYFTAEQKTSEVEEVIEKALEFYFNHQNHNREQETHSQENESSYQNDDDMDHEDDDQEI